MENINWICKAKTVNNNIVWMCNPRLKEHFEATTNTVQLFSAANYGGNSSSFGIGRYTSTQLDKIGPKALQSIKVPSGLVALLYQNADFTGYGKAITADTPDLSKVTDSKNTGFNWSNQMQSLIVQPHVALPTSISDSMPKISLVAPDPNSFITAVSGAKLTRIQDSSYLYVDPNNPDNLFWYNAGDLQIIPPFSISTISGLTLWLDGNDPLANGIQPANNAAITQWVNKASGKTSMSFNGNPTFNANFAGSQGALKFNGNAFIRDTVFTCNLASKTFFMICNTFNGTSSSNNPQGFFVYGLNGKGYDVQDGCAYQGPEASFNNSFGFLQAYGNNGYYHSVGTSFKETSLAIYSDTTSERDASIYVNGSNVANKTLGYTPSKSTGFQIGQRLIGFPLLGNICEILSFDIVLSDPQRQIIEGYLAWKWGLQSSLPDNHPFKSAAPSGSTAFPKVPKFFLANIEKSKPESQVNFISMSSDGKNIVAQGIELATVLSTDYGKTWKKIFNKNLDNMPYMEPLLITDQGQILVTTTRHGIYFSSDLGVTFKEVCERVEHPRPPACSKDGKIWYVPLYTNHIWKSTDSGNTFQKLPRIPGNGMLSCVSCTDDGNTVYMCTAGGSDGHIYKSTDGANNWTKINKEKNPRGGGVEGNGTWLRVFCSSDGTIVLGLNMDPIVLMVSSDSGNTWNDINPPGNRVSPFGGVALSKDGSTIVIGCSQPMTLLKSTNLGKTWTQLPKTGLEAKGYYFDLAISKDGSSLAAATFQSDIGSFAIMN